MLEDITSFSNVLFGCKILESSLYVKLTQWPCLLHIFRAFFFFKQSKTCQTYRLIYRRKNSARAWIPLCQ